MHGDARCTMLYRSRKRRRVSLSTTPGPTTVAIQGNGVVGQTLTAGRYADRAQWFTYQWKRNGTNIGSATGQTYTLQGADSGANVTVQARAYNSAGSSVAVTSAAKAVA